MKYEFGVMASITELVEYPDEQNDAYVAHPNFQIIMDQLGITVPVAEIYEHFFANPVHNGHVLVYSNPVQPNACIVLDTYRDPLDQLDMIYFGWRCSSEIDLIRELSRRFYDECEFAVRYEEGQSVLYKLLKEDTYPRKFYYNTVFEQQLKRYPAK
ncbi:hypothetical protein NST45_14055 [Paenibacillus sp. FSL R7-0163]|uniref:hypothetical protein n=1 Tax=Paenibacillus TaxID=44249 RepID=UPI00096F3B2A|nr:hypothetical protein [Paenibacillus odorifer]OMD06158.1 hypothetical protein BJP47_14575 [Paenibacillus odorifer]